MLPVLAVIIFIWQTN